MLEFFKTFLNSDDLASLNPTALNMSGSSVAVSYMITCYYLCFYTINLIYL